MSEYDFDVAVTFAGEDRVFVNEVVELVKEAGFSVFYDEDAKVEMWGPGPHRVLPRRVRTPRSLRRDVRFHALRGQAVDTAGEAQCPGARLAEHNAVLASGTPRFD